jgi:hypothetical protein
METGVVNDVRVELYRAFIEENRAPTLVQMAAALDISHEEVERAVNELATRDIIALHPDTQDPWMVHPFLSGEGPFTVTSGERRWDAICIWDALGILALIEIDGEVRTICPDCREALSVKVLQGEVQAEDDAVVHFGVPARDWYEDIGFT